MIDHGMQSRGAMLRAVLEITMKDKKLKKAIRAQQARMGEGTSYSAARLTFGGNAREYSAPAIAGTLEHRIRALIPMAVAAAAVKRGNASPTLKGPTVLDPVAALDQALRLFSAEDLHRIQAVMYAGRELDPSDNTRAAFHDFHQNLPKYDPDTAIFAIAEKVSLAAYLERGLELARECGANIDQLGKSLPPKNSPRPQTSLQAPASANEPDEELDRSSYRRQANTAWLRGLQRATGSRDLLSRTWTDLNEIVAVLQSVGGFNSNHMFYPTGGGNDLESASLGGEPKCIELFYWFGGRCAQILKPRTLTLNAIQEIPSMSYLRLELDALAPTGLLGAANLEKEELTEIEPLQYADRSVWDDGETLTSSRLVRRWLRGAFVIFSKGSLYNSFDDYWKGDTYDGRHNRMDAASFRGFIDRLVANAIARGLPVD